MQCGPPIGGRVSNLWALFRPRLSLESESWPNVLARPTPRPACLPVVIEFMSCSESWLHYQPRLRLPMAFNCTIYMQNVQSAALKILQPSPALPYPSLSTQITTGADAAALWSKGLAQHSAKLKNFYKSALIPKTIKRATIATSSRLNKQQKKKKEKPFSTLDSAII